MPFSPTEPAVVVRADGRSFALDERLAYIGAHDVFCLPPDMATDFATIPNVVAWALPKLGSYTMAAMLHDYFCLNLAERHRLGEEPIVSARDADGIFRRVMREEGTDFVTRWLVWAGVRWGALMNPARSKGWERDAALVVVISVLALPVLILPAWLGGPVLRAVGMAARLVGLR